MGRACTRSLPIIRHLKRKVYYSRSYARVSAQGCALHSSLTVWGLCLGRPLLLVWLLLVLATVRLATIWRWRAHGRLRTGSVAVGHEQ